MWRFCDSGKQEKQMPYTYFIFSSFLLFFFSSFPVSDGHQKRKRGKEEMHVPSAFPVRYLKTQY